MDIEVRERFETVEEDIKNHSSVIGDLQAVVMGPPPARSNGLCGTIKNHLEDHKEMSSQKTNLHGVYLMGFLQFAGAIIVAIIMKLA